MGIVFVGCGGFACEVARSYVDTMAGVPNELSWEEISFWSEMPNDLAPNGRPLRKPNWDDYVHVAIGDNRTRKRMMTECQRPHDADCGFGLALDGVPTVHQSPTFSLDSWFSVLDARAIISSDAGTEVGCYVGAGSVVASRAKIGCGVIVNYLCSVGHDARLGDFSQLAPHANVLGRCVIDEGAFIGGSAVVFPNVFVGAWSVIGAGSVVTSDVPAGEVWYGNPAKFVRRIA